VSEFTRIYSLFTLLDLFYLSSLLDLNLLHKLSDLWDHVLVVNVVSTHNSLNEFLRLVSAAQYFFTLALLELIFIEVALDHTIADRQELG